MIAAVTPRPFEVILTGDSLRLGTVKDADRCVVALVPGGAEGDVETTPTSSAVQVHLPKRDRRAYARASRAFNKVMDRHEQRRPPELREIDQRDESLRAAVLTYHGVTAD